MALMQGSPVPETLTAAPASGCPFHTAPAVKPAPATGCPVHASPAGAIGRRSAADFFVRRLLRVPDSPVGTTTASAYSAFQRSMLISALRCTLTYVIFPFVLPALSFANGLGPIIGIVIGSIAIVCDVFSVRRFFVVDHRWRWRFAAVASGVIVLLAVLLVQDIVHLAT
jgi:hypothetical protein